MPLLPVPPGVELPLADRDATLADGRSRAELRDRLDELGRRLRDLQETLYADGSQGLLVVLQGRDACGKDGTIKRVFDHVNPQGLAVRAFGVPTELERRHEFLWRIHRAVGPRGHVTVFNRSHYEDVLVVRARGLAPEPVWRPRYEQINAFERLLAAGGYVIRKFFLHVSRDEQRKRLEARLADPEKNWKFRVGDLEDRARWDEFTAAYREAIARCSTAEAPWYVVPADDKPLRDVLVAEILVATLEAMDLRHPPADPEALALRGRIP